MELFHLFNQRKSDPMGQVDVEGYAHGWCWWMESRILYHDKVQDHVAPRYPENQLLIAMQIRAMGSVQLTSRTVPTVQSNVTNSL